MVHILGDIAILVTELRSNYHRVEFIWHKGHPHFEWDTSFLNFWFKVFLDRVTHKGAIKMKFMNH